MIGTSLLYLASAVSAAGVTDDRCGNAMTQREMNACAYSEYEQADRDMNAQWKITAAVQKKIDAEPDRATDRRPGYFDTLLAAQRAWLTYRENHCRSEGYLMRGGSAEPLLTYGCLATLTRARTAQLNDLAEEK